MCSSSCLYIGSPKSYSFISDLSEFLLTSIAFATLHAAPMGRSIIHKRHVSCIETFTLNYDQPVVTVLQRMPLIISELFFECSILLKTSFRLYRCIPLMRSSPRNLIYR